MHRRGGFSIVLGVITTCALFFFVVPIRADSQSHSANITGLASLNLGLIDEATPLPVRRVLATGLPPTAPGQTLDLVRYDIPAGMMLPVHIHPGMQIAWVAAGELTYHVIKGEVQIGRATGSSTAAPNKPEVLRADGMTTLLPGDWVVEIPGTVHYGENLGSETVVLWATTLLESGAPAAIPVNNDGTPVN